MSGLISDANRDQQETLHQDPNYGRASLSFASIVGDTIIENDVSELLDYGAGKGRLGQKLQETIPDCPKIYHYDPAIPEWSALPAPCEFVTCIDVLEHIEPERLDDVLEDLERVTLRLGFFTVHTGAAQRVLPDGRNAHLIQEPPQFWLNKFMDRFELLFYKRTRTKGGQVGFFTIVGSKKAAISSV